LRIANNVPALITHINLRQNDRLMSASMNRLSTGLRINSAREDAAGMAIANKLSFQLVGLERASDNSTHGISLIQTAEGALNEVHAMLQRIRELSVQAANETNVTQDQMAIQREINDLTDEISALSNRAEFNTIKLLNGEASRVATSWIRNAYDAFGVSAPSNQILTRVIANPLFISEGTPAGTLQYTILAPGTSAQVTGAASALNMSARAPVSGRMNINGVFIDVVQGQTVASIWEQLVRISDYAGVIPTLPRPAEGVPLAFTSIRNGAHEQVHIDGNHHLWNLFGIYMPPTAYAYGVQGDSAYGVSSAYPVPMADVTAAGVSGVISIDGWPISISEGMTPQDIFRAIEDAANLSVHAQLNTNEDLANHIISGPQTGDYGVRSFEVVVDPDTGAWSIQRMMLMTDPVTGETVLRHPPGYTGNGPRVLADNHELLAAIGLGSSNTDNNFTYAEDSTEPAPSAYRQAVYDRGTDLKVTGVTMLDPFGIPIAEFNNSIAISTSGNTLNVSSAQGHTIRLNINVPASYRGNDTLGAMVTAPGIRARDNDGNYHSVRRIDEATGGFVTGVGNAPSLTPGYAYDFVYVPGLEDAIDMSLRIEAFGGLRVQIGPNYNMNMDIVIPRINAETLGLVEFQGGRKIRQLHLTTHEGAQRAIQIADNAINQVSLVRSRLGAYQNRLEHTITNLNNAALNTESARSRIQDTDMAREMTLLSKRNVMYQAGLAILAQANQRPQMVLSLLQ